MLILGEDSIRETIAFPKNQQSKCLLTDAPSNVSNSQLKELDIEKINLDNVEIRREWKFIDLLIILDDLVVCIENKIFYSPLVCDTKIHKTTKLKVPNSRRLLKQSISIPLHEKMTIEQTKYVIRTVKNFYN